MGVLVEPAVAHHGKAEQPFDNVEWMLDLGPYLGVGAVLGSGLFDADASVVGEGNIAGPLRLGVFVGVSLLIVAGCLRHA